MSNFSPHYQFTTAGYLSHRPTRCPKLTREHHQGCWQWAKRHSDWDLHHRRHCVFSDESRFKLYHSNGRIRVRRREGKRYNDVCVHQTDGNVVPSIMVWGTFHFRDKSELVIVESPMNQQVYRWVLRQSLLPWARGTFHNNFVLVQDNAPPQKHGPLWLFLKFKMWRSWRGQPKARIWALLSISGTKWPSIFVTWITLLQHNNYCIMQGWLPRMPLGLRDWGPCEEHATAGACCSRHLWRTNKILSAYKCSQRPFHPSHQKLEWLKIHHSMIFFYLLCTISW